MNNRVKVNLNDLNVLRSFVHTVTQFESDVNIIKGSHTFDAKSLLAVIDIAPDLRNTFAEIVTDDEEEIKNFMFAMEDFKA